MDGRSSNDAIQVLLFISVVGDTISVGGEIVVEPIIVTVENVVLLVVVAGKSSP